MKQIYISAWILLAVAAFVMVLTGSLNSVALMVLSLIALGLIYALAFWAAITDTWEMKTE